MRQQRLDFNGKRDKHVMCSLSLTELEAVERGMIRFGFRRRAEFMRWAAMHVAGARDLAVRCSAAYRRAPRARVRVEHLDASIGADLERDEGGR